MYTTPAFSFPFSIMKRPLLLLSILSLGACSLPSSPKGTTPEPSSPEAVEQPMPVITDDGEAEDVEEMIVEDEDDEDEGEEELMEEEKEDEVMEEKRVIEVSVDNWSFTPATITAEKGETVEIKLVGAAGTHGFAIPGLGINMTVNAGETVTVALPTGSEGTFEFFCSIPCGSGHKDMRGTVTIQP